MKFVLNLNCVNDVFQPDPRLEISRILRDVADQLDNGETADYFRTIFDANGNDVGRFKILKD